MEDASSMSGEATLAGAHAALPGPEREVLAYAFVSGLGPQEIGDLMGLEAGAVVELRALGLLALGDALWGTRVLAHVKEDAACRRALCSGWGARPARGGCLPAREALARATAAYARWALRRPAPGLRDAVLHAAAGELARRRSQNEVDFVAASEDALVGR
ncbi:hypothetical protein [Conexibacter sp. SYSU D00693]|uniref:hypothetical protein n=1 Tax=Conexibacter sp. SYSU D00693 TaxID=2812560 RepID=UPI00196B07E2|nr:hypothetical protein [Conexibacter sp. SYSU D00693]